MTKFYKYPSFVKQRAKEIGRSSKGRAIFAYPQPIQEAKPALHLRPSDWVFLSARFAEQDPAETADADRFTCAIDALHHHIAQTERRDLFLFGSSLCRVLDAFDSPALLAEPPGMDLSIIFSDGSVAEISWDYCPGVFFEYTVYPYQHLNLDLKTLGDILYLVGDRDPRTFYPNLAFLKAFGDPSSRLDDAYQILRDIIAPEEPRIIDCLRQSDMFGRNDETIIKSIKDAKDLMHACLSCNAIWSRTFVELYELNEPSYAVASIEGKIEEAGSLDGGFHALPRYRSASDAQMEDFRDFLEALSRSDGDDHQTSGLLRLAYEEVEYGDFSEIPELQALVDQLQQDELDMDVSEIARQLAARGITPDPNQDFLHSFVVQVADGNEAPTELTDAILRLHQALGGVVMIRERERPDIFFDHSDVWEWHAEGCRPMAPIGAFCGFDDDDYSDERKCISVYVPICEPGSAHRRLEWLTTHVRKAEDLIARWGASAP